MNRRDFLTQAAIGGSGLIVAGHLSSDTVANPMPHVAERSFEHRIAYGCWINDMRMSPLPFEDWPAPQMDNETVKGIVAALDLQSRYGYNYLDVWGLLATKAWPVTLGDGLSEDRKSRVRMIISEAHHRGMKVIYGMGTFSWGLEEIIEKDRELAAINRDGSHNMKALCDANPKSFEWIQRILDNVLSEFDFDGVHLESFDQGGCFCEACAGKSGIVEYHARINSKTAQYIKSKWPQKLVCVIPIGWAMDSDERFTESDKREVIKLSRHIDGFYDQGWHGTYVPADERGAFIKQLRCVYGTSGGRWVYPGQRWDRQSFFIPHMRHQARAMREQFAHGVRGVLHYQGPVNNPGTEMNIACGGLIASNVERNIEDVLAQVVEDLYRPQTIKAHATLVNVFSGGEEAYFDQWVDAAERFRKHWNTGPAGEFYMDNLFGDSPGPAGYLANPVYLDGAGRLAYKKALIRLSKNLLACKQDFKDGGRIEALQRSLMITLTLLNTIMHVKEEPLT